MKLLLASIVAVAAGGCFVEDPPGTEAARLVEDHCCHLVGPYHEVDHCVEVGPGEDECFDACIEREGQGSYCAAYYTTEGVCEPGCGDVP